MRILINALSASTGGGLTYARSLIPLLREELRDSLVLYGRDLVSVFSEGNGALQVHNPLARGSRRFLWEQAHLERLLAQRRIQVLYTPYQVAIQPGPFKFVCALRNLEPFFSPGYSYTIRSSVRNSLLRCFTRRSLQRAHRVIAVSDFAEDLAVSSLGLPREKVMRVYHGRDESLLERDTSEDESIRRDLGINGPYIFTAGSILPYRRVEDVIAAFGSIVAATEPMAMLLIAGLGTDRRYGKSLRQAMAGSSYRPRIRALGYLTHSQMRALYKGCRLFVSASEVEACPNIGIEAMTAGCPVIASRSGPAEEIYGDGAILYPQRDVGRLAELMADVWRDEKLRQELSLRAVERSKAFSWRICARETAAVLEGV